MDPRVEMKNDSSDVQKSSHSPVRKSGVAHRWQDLRIDMSWRDKLPRRSSSLTPSEGSSQSTSAPTIHSDMAIAIADLARTLDQSGGQALRTSDSRKLPATPFESPPNARSPRMSTASLQSRGDSGESLVSQESHSQPSKVRSSPQDQFTLELPKSLLNLSAEEAWQFTKLALTTEDDRLLSIMPLEEELSMGANHLVKLLVCFSRLQKRTGDADLTRQLVEKDEELNALKQRLAEHEEVATSLQTRLNKADGEIAALLSDKEKLKYKLIDTVHHYKEKLKEVGERSLVEGIEHCRQNLLMTEAGQGFLHRLLVGFQEAYLRSSKSLADMAPHISHYYAYGFDSAQQQAKEQGFNGTFDFNGPLDKIPEPPGFAGDPNEPVDTAWWLPVMQEAFSTLRRANLPTPLLPRADVLLYPLVEPPPAPPSLLIFDH